MYLRLQLPERVYIAQNIFGMESSDPVALEEQEEAEEPEGAAAIGAAGGQVGEEPQQASAPQPTAGADLDADATECVICLTDSREVC